MVVRPMTVEPAFVRPKGVDEIQAFFLHMLERNLQAGKRMQRGGGREQVWNRRGWSGQKTTLGVEPSQ